MQNELSATQPLFSPLALILDKAILGLFLMFVACGASPVGAADVWEPMLAGKCDLETVLNQLEVEPQVLVESLQAEAAAGTSRTARRRLGVLLIQLGRPEEAVPWLEEAVAQAEEVGDAAAYAFSSLHLGRALVHTRQVELAGEHLRVALAGAVATDTPLWEGSAAIALSVIARWTMDLDASLAYREQALAAYERADYVKGQARALHYIGTIYAFRGELTRAMTTLHRGLEAARSVDFGVEIAGSLVELAGVNFLLGDFDRALAQYEEAAALTAHPWRRGQLEINQGSLLAEQGRHTEALPYFDRALELMRQVGDHRTEAEILQAIGRSRCELEEFEVGLARLDEAIALAREWQVPMTEAYALHYKGYGLLDQNRLDEALVVLAQADTLARETGYFDIIESCQRAQALVARRRGRLDEALEHMDEALAVVSDVRRRSSGSGTIQAGYFSQTGRTFDALIDLLFEMHEADPQAGYDRRAFDVAQQAGARSFLDLLAEGDVDLRCRADKRYQDREREILDMIAELNLADSSVETAARIAHLGNELDLLEAEVRAADPRYADLCYPRPCALDQVCDGVLHEGELLLEYYLGEKASFVWALSPEGFAFYRLPAAAWFEEQVLGLLPMLRDYNVLGEDAAYFTAQIEPLSRSLLDPVATQLARSSRVTVVTDGALHYLPFEVLLTEAAGGRKFSALPYLVLQVEVARVPSVSALRLLRGKVPAPDANGLLLLADPVAVEAEATSVFARAAGAAGLGAVPFVAEEISGVTAHFAESERLVLRGEAATAAGLRQASARAYRCVHFATHGVFNERIPRFSGLILSPDDCDDGFLTAGEIFALELECEQVVLSACSSALGERISGEGIVGLTRAFFFAGADNVVAALWDVAGSGAAVFMSDYYSRSGSPPAALAATKRAMIRGELALPGDVSLAHPCFWAAFVVSGR